VVKVAKALPGGQERKPAGMGKSGACPAEAVSGPARSA